MERARQMSLTHSRPVQPIPRDVWDAIQYATGSEEEVEVEEEEEEEEDDEDLKGYQAPATTARPMSARKQAPSTVEAVAKADAARTGDPSNIPPEIKELFAYIGKYALVDIDMEPELRPFIPDFIPAIGDIDAFIKVS